MSHEVMGGTAYELMRGCPPLTDRQAEALAAEYSKLGLRYEKCTWKGENCVVTKAPAEAYKEFMARRPAISDIGVRIGFAGDFATSSNTYQPGLTFFSPGPDWDDKVAFIDAKFSSRSPRPTVTAPRQVIRWNCVACGKRLKSTTENEGKNGKCPTCGKVQVVPRRAPDPPQRAPASGPKKAKSATPGFDELVEELVRIGAAVKDPTYSSSGYLAKDSGDNITRDPRAREIGQRLHEMGEMTMMQRAHQVVKDRLGRLPARELEACWGGVGNWLA